jgi:hypothetical protein
MSITNDIFDFWFDTKYEIKINPDQGDMFIPLRDERVWREIALCHAVLESGLEDYLKYQNSNRSENRQLFEDAEYWLFYADSSCLYSFEFICELLGLDAGAVRERLLEMQDVKLRQFRREKESSMSGSQKIGGTFIK